jgi:hypothetical protein
MLQRGSRTRQSSPLRTPVSAGAASLYLRGNVAPETSSSRVLEPHWSTIICSAENPAPEGNPWGLKHTRMEAIFKKFNMKTNFKLNINVMRKYFELQIYPLKPSVGLPISWDYPINFIIYEYINLYLPHFFEYTVDDLKVFKCNNLYNPHR